MQHADSTLTRVRIPKDQFGRYLRTGSWARPDESVELKFNPWHDPKTGRFTSKGGGNGTWRGGGFTGGGGGSFDGGGASGSWTGGSFTGGGGGSFGGAGATGHGDWGPDTPRSKAKPAVAGTSATTQAVRAATSTSQNGTAWHSVERNGYAYQLDAADRTRQVTGTLTLNPDQSRSRTAQAGAGGSDRLPTDDGGHYVAVRFNGPTDTFNHFAQDANFNRGGYRVLENQWAKDIKEGKQVYVAITPTYVGSSKRPSDIDVVFMINGKRNIRSFGNTSKGKSHGK